MILSRITNKPAGVHPFVWQSLLGRVCYNFFAIFPCISTLRHIKADFFHYFVLISILVLVPPIDYFLARQSNDPKRWEMIINMKADAFCAGIFLPLLHFNPFVVLYIFMGIGFGAVVAGGYRLLITRLSCIFPSAVVCVTIFGFNYDIGNLIVVVTGSFSILFMSLASAFLTYGAAKGISRAKKQLREQKQKLDAELSEAAKYVRAILPAPENIGPIKTDWRFIPSTSLGGDAFGYHWLDEDHFAIYLADVSGHGVGAALLSVSVVNALRSESLPHTNFKKPEQVLLSALNKAFPGEENNDMFFSIWYGVYEKRERLLSYASGGHPPAILISKPGNENCIISKLWTHNYVVGSGMPDVSYKKSEHLIDPDSRLYIFSDGVYEIQKSDGLMWRFDEFVDFIQSPSVKGETKIQSLIDYGKEMIQGDSFEDDFTIMEIKFT